MPDLTRTNESLGRADVIGLVLNHPAILQELARRYARTFFLHGTAAQRPTAGVLGRTYYAADTNALSWDSGTAWATVDLAQVTRGGGTVAVSVAGNISAIPKAGGTLSLGGSGDQVGAFGATPASRPAAYTQTYATASRTLGAYTANDQSAAYTGIDNAQAGTVYAKLADLNTLRVAVENLRALCENATKVENSVLDDLQALGWLA